MASLREYPLAHACGHSCPLPFLFKPHHSGYHHSIHLLCGLAGLCLHHMISPPSSQSPTVRMPYLTTSRTHEPSYMPPPDSQPIWFALLPTSGIYTLFTLIVASPTILITVEGLPSYQANLTCQLLMQLLHLISLAQIQHFQACPNDLPSNLGLPLRTTLFLLVGPILKLLHTHSFHRYLEELLREVLFPAFQQVYRTLSQAEQQHYQGQTGLHTSPSPIPLALQILSHPTSPASAPVNNDPIHIQIAEGQWITSLSSHVLVQCSRSCSPSTQCHICSDLSHYGLFCPMYHCPNCQETAPGHAAHHCLATQCDLCRRWGHTDKVCTFRICGRCDNPGHVVDNCPIHLLDEPTTRSTYEGTYSDDNNLNTLVENN